MGAGPHTDHRGRPDRVAERADAIVARCEEQPAPADALLMRRDGYVDPETERAFALEGPCAIRSAVAGRSIVARNAGAQVRAPARAVAAADDVE